MLDTDTIQFIEMSRRCYYVASAGTAALRSANYVAQAPPPGDGSCSMQQAPATRYVDKGNYINLVPIYRPLF